MSTLKHISIEVGDQFSIVRVVMSDGRQATAIGTINDEGKQTIVVEAEDRDELFESFVHKVAEGCFSGILTATCEE